MHRIPLPVLVLGIAASASAAPRVSGPYVHENLALYLIHGEDQAAGRDILTLGAALAQGEVVVHETGNVNELAIENVSKHKTVLVQAGDIVKGGRQDRVLSQDLVLGPRSGRVPIASFCVEQGRWRQRAGESAEVFRSSDYSLSSKELKLAARKEADQGKVWQGVADLQRRLQRATGHSVEDEASRTSLALSLENDRLADHLQGYREALAGLPESHPDAVGFAAAVNGSIHSAEVYATADLFRQQWTKLLTAAATEALAAHAPAARLPAPPEPLKLQEFLEHAESGAASSARRAMPEKTDARETDRSLYFESRQGEAADTWLNKSYLAK